MEVPSDRRYSKEHEWALVQDDGTILVGITEFAQDELGDVVFVELPSAGSSVAQHAQMGEIESVKAVSELFSPVSGEILETNSQVETQPDLVNTSPYNDGWLVKIKPSDTTEMESLLDPDQYGKLIS